jgi:hypothetical protein
MVVSEGDLDHLLPEFRPAALLPDDERIVRVRSERWIGHRVARAVLADLQEIVDQPPRGRMLNALLTAAPGMGKTMTLKKLARNNTQNFDRQTGVAPQPVVYVLMPDVPNEEAFFCQVLASLGTSAIASHFDAAAPRHRIPAAARMRDTCTCHRRDQLGARRIAAAAARFSAVSSLSVK